MSLIGPSTSAAVAAAPRVARDPRRQRVAHQHARRRARTVVAHHHRVREARPRNHRAHARRDRQRAALVVNLPLRPPTSTCGVRLSLSVAVLFDEFVSFGVDTVTVFTNCAVADGLTDAITVYVTVPPTARLPIVSLIGPVPLLPSVPLLCVARDPRPAACRSPTRSSRRARTVGGCSPPPCT